MLCSPPYWRFTNAFHLKHLSLSYYLSKSHSHFKGQLSQDLSNHSSSCWCTIWALIWVIEFILSCISLLDDVYNSWFFPLTKFQAKFFNHIFLILEFYFCHIHAVWLRSSHSVSENFNFPICRMEKILWKGLAHSKFSLNVHCLHNIIYKLLLHPMPRHSVHI
jgi:hypothetical protein